MEEIVALCIPIGVCVVLPVMVVWLALKSRNHTVDKNAEIISKAIENGQEIDPELLMVRREKKTGGIKMELLRELRVGVVFTVLGLAFIILSSLGFLNDVAGVGFNVFLLCGLIFVPIGLGGFVSYFVGRHSLKEEMALELEARRNASKKEEGDK
ncbi:MAG: DUF6249 domain-containing protein [Candidatus Cryptobacteroides sp.]